MPQREVHIMGGDDEGEGAPRGHAERMDRLEVRIAKLEKWVYFVSGATGAVGYLLGASGVIHKLLAP